jgi:hypothetical protein
MNELMTAVTIQNSVMFGWNIGPLKIGRSATEQNHKFIQTHKTVIEVANILKFRNLKHRKQWKNLRNGQLQICLDVNLTADHKMLINRNIYMADEKTSVLNLYVDSSNGNVYHFPHMRMNTRGSHCFFLTTC